MKKNYKDAWRLLISNWDTLLVFQFIYICIFFLFQTVVKMLVSLAMQSSRMEYLTNEAALQILSNPVSIFFLVISAVVFGVYLYFECMVFCVYFRYAGRQERLSIKKLFLEALKEPGEYKLSFHIALFFYILILVVVFGAPFHTFFSNSLQIPEFIMDFINQSTLLKLIFNGTKIFFAVFFMLLMFVPFEMVLNYESWKTACKKSRVLVRKHFFQTIVSVLIWNLILTVICDVVFLGVLLFVAFYTKASQQGIGFFWFFFKRGEAIYRLFQPMIITCGNLALLLVVFLKLRGEKLFFMQMNSRKYSIWKIARVMLFFMGMILTIEFIDASVYQTYDWNTPEIIAHRAGGKFAPENTVSGLEEAILSGSDCAEVDVVQTADGVLVLSHDDSLKRITGTEKRISQLTYEELQNYDAGAYFGMQHQGEQFPSLQEILEKSKNKMNLMIELKSGQDDIALVEKTLNLIYDSQTQEQCVIASLNLDILREVRKRDGSIQTAYITAFAYGDLTAVDVPVDIFAIESTYVSKQMINELRAQGKKIFIWTVNKEQQLEKISRLPVDGIITDNPYLAQYVMASRGLDPVILLFVKWIENAV